MCFACFLERRPTNTLHPHPHPPQPHSLAPSPTRTPTPGSLFQLFRANAHKCPSYLFLATAVAEASRKTMPGAGVYSCQPEKWPSAKGGNPQELKCTKWRHLCSPTYAALAALGSPRFFKKRQKKVRAKKTTGGGWLSSNTWRHTMECEMDSVAQSAFHKAFFPRLPSNLRRSHANYAHPE